eukprot:6422100-Amphidinium_carterae.1
MPALHPDSEKSLWSAHGGTDVRSNFRSTLLAHVLSRLWFRGACCLHERSACFANSSSRNLGHSHVMSWYLVDKQSMWCAQGRSHFHHHGLRRCACSTYELTHPGQVVRGA